ncbi:nucleoside recognition domain-containing protein [Marinigracilibium pacificum]|uniref:Nucleoside transporter/FeoB GTPase Gate domain-containing protein n=1 Tax=Marinigracilibium pacificum TaxID=2729599 RepID=A0A848J3Z8_9BACT|nr:nucleoside recognition domain-containing protein [Marinigracilibium pacificum]NMM50048.1 hypothetical protein [Marinigracilibium pacificum]
MILNYIFILFFVLSFVAALIRFIVYGDASVFTTMVNSMMDAAQNGFELALFLTGTIALWLGILKVGEKAGMIKFISKLVNPFFVRIFPEIPDGHPVIGNIVMNFSANFLGLGNAATPLGLKAMQGLQDLNPDKNRASNAQIMFLVLNTSGLTVIPITALAVLEKAGTENPGVIFLPIIIATFFSSMGGLIVMAIWQKINLFNKVIMLYLGSMTAIIVGVLYFFTKLTSEQVQQVSAFAGNFIILSIIILFIVVAWKKKINVYETFIDGAREGFQISIKIIPYLVAILAAIALLKSSLILENIILMFEYLFEALSVDTSFVPSLLTAFIRPLSGSGALATIQVMSEQFGPDSFQTLLSSVMLGSTETTFYVLALYFGSVSIRNTRYAVAGGLIADFIGILAAILCAYLFFGDKI